MRTLLLIALALPTLAAEMKASRQDRKVLLAYADGAPVSLSLYAAQVCGTGPGEERFNPDLVLFMAADYGAVQDSDAALYAAKEGRKRSLPYKVVNVMINGIEYTGFLVVGLATGNVLVIPKLVTGLIAGAATFIPRLLKHKDDLEQQPVPAGWITPGMPDRILGPGRCDHYTFLMDSETDKTFHASTVPQLLAPPPLQIEIPKVIPTVDAPAPKTTAPMPPDRETMSAAEYIVAVLHPGAW